MQKQINSFDGVKINYDIVRENKNSGFLVFLHGAGGNLTAWNKELHFFHRKGISTLAIDFRGHGKSARPDNVDDYDLENFAKDVFEILKKEKIKDFILIGHCFGGMVVTIFHKLFPTLAQSYILVDTTYKAPKKMRYFFKANKPFVFILNYFLEKMKTGQKSFSHMDFEKYVGTGDWNVKRIFSDIIHTTFKSWIFTYQNIAKFDAIEILKSIKKRVLIIEGEKDSVFNMLEAKKINSLIKNSELNVIPEANHILVLNNPHELQKEIYGFVKNFKDFV
ncbi:MAG: carboxylesterase (est-1) [uncultured bacterium]|nr:MAG: carboxylesterase (est-1) [uncultured bacterium]OGH83879.1 MAG: hypothetical protein A2488_01790 [Candidatus Magasanikbacteria bacterium RIFOXYC12_FULL_32_21b]OGH89168.1 MAG: hypothetical protein A2507_04395 [Candidatus Magasanikbacteria bacterium RIFOXYD12_FULL_33_17]HAO52575.1 hypothetical protein [Candidatus Magasanikbacteria bacterium]